MHSQLEVCNNIHSKSNEEVETHTNKESIQRTYRIPIRYLNTPILEYLSYTLYSASMHSFVRWAGAMMRKPKYNKMRGKVTA
jgi:hypothetical protein